MQNIIELLKADHKEVKELLRKLTADQPTEDCDALFEKLYASVKRHARFEEEEVYPLLKKKEDTKDLALEAYEEHQQAMTLLEALNELDDEDDTCDAKMQVLSEDLNHHIKEEESELFPALKKAVTADVLQRLGVAYQETKDSTGAEDNDTTADDMKAEKPATRSRKSAAARSR